MYSSMCFMSIVTLLVMDVRTGALQERDIQPRRCYNCLANNTTSCEQSNAWTIVMCSAERPHCATTASSPGSRSSLICASPMKKPCTVQTPSNSSFVITCICDDHLCNAPFSTEWRNELFNLTTNNTDLMPKVCELFGKFKNNSEANNLYKAITTQFRDAVAATVRSTPQPDDTIASAPATVNMIAILRDSERPRAEALKQEPTVPSDDDEDESEGSGSYEESRIHKHAVSAPAAPSSFLPANENSAASLYKDLLVTTLFIYLVV